jgi:glycosyltransferase involved in cell wall biosynthesis
MKGKNLHEVQPTGFINKLFPSLWRSSKIKKDLIRLNINLYHGLSHEIPVGIQNTGIKTAVTIHDLIHERNPGQYNPVDVKIYRKKFRYACTHADRIIAISQQTKKDIIEFYKIPGEKITVCYLSCNKTFEQNVGLEQKQRVKKEYKLPDEYFLYVGSVIERKNLLGICKALFLLRHDLDIPLVVIGSGKKYKQQVKDFLMQNGIEQKVIFLSENPAAKQASFQNGADFPAIYQQATALIYPSFFEGFGIPVLEALWSRVPVITSNLASMPEAGGNGAYYVNPASAEEIAGAMKIIYSDKPLAAALVEKGWQHAQNFTQEKCAAAVMEVYKSFF